MEPHPISLHTTGDLTRSRLTVFFRGLLIIPHIIVLMLWTIAAYVVWIVAFFAGLFTGHLPEGMHNFLAGYVRYATRIHAYQTLAANSYPPFSGSAPYEVDLTIAPPAQQSRWGIFFRSVLSIPAYIMTALLNGVNSFVYLAAWFCAMFTGRIPRGLNNWLLLISQLQAQLLGYLMFLTAKYPRLDPWSAPVQGADGTQPATA